MRELNGTESEAIERIIDACGLANVLSAIDQICCEKAQHIRENWQDDKTARTWDHGARHIIIAAERAKEYGL